ncbi:DEAD/DEAH box helicase [Actinobaculum sp. 352]|uniref:DEAD/DEAH box helicase n=1 Tax=Actinobaculum sp. 352 TaxID=2490946 RepID=UPI000F7EF1F8|nr:DEAD/DEAH box helicase [Actinobaculum sp. 352]RTE49625.1 DEAD/DEAH box helicase [Actinobaculum sp. 352]
MHYQPHDYQTYTTRFIETHTQAAILLGMGLGKTVATLTAINNLLHDGHINKPLIIAPLRVATTTWPQEIIKWDHLTHLTPALITGTPTHRLHALNQPADLHIINRENIPWLVNHHTTTNTPWPYDMVIIDELSSFKNHTAKRFKALLKVRPHINRIIGLTGTPTPNGLLDLYAQYRLLDGGQRLGKYITHYRATYFTPDKRNATQIFTWKPKPGAEQAIYHRIKDITVSMKTTDHLNLPPITYITHPVTMTPTEHATYTKLQHDMITTINDTDIDAASAAVLSSKLSQLATGAIYTQTPQGTPTSNYTTLHNHKLDTLEDLLEAANGNPVLIAYWYKHDHDRIHQRFPHIRDLTTPTDIADWNHGRIPAALIHPAAAGHGLNLQDGGHDLIWFSLTWSLELYQQANARIYRQGQTHPVTIHHLTTTNTIDPLILDALHRKNTTQQALINAVKTTLTGGETHD